MEYTSNGFEFEGVSTNDIQRPNNILVTDATGKRKCFIIARFNYMEKASITLKDGHNFKKSDHNCPQIVMAIEALQQVYGPGLPVHNNLANHVQERSNDPVIAHGPVHGCRAVYGDEFPY